MPIIDYQTLVKQITPFERAIPNDARIAVCDTSEIIPKSLTAEMPTMLPNSHLGILAVLSDGGAIVPILTASDLLRKLKALWKDTQD